MACSISRYNLKKLREAGQDLTLGACPIDRPSPAWHPVAMGLFDRLCCYSYAESQALAEMEHEGDGGRGRVRRAIPTIPDLQPTPPSSLDQDDQQQGEGGDNVRCKAPDRSHGSRRAPSDGTAVATAEEQPSRRRGSRSPSPADARRYPSDESHRGLATPPRSAAAAPSVRPPPLPLPSSSSSAAHLPRPSRNPAPQRRPTAGSRRVCAPERNGNDRSADAPRALHCEARMDERSQEGLRLLARPMLVTAATTPVASFVVSSSPMTSASGRGGHATGDYGLNGEGLDDGSMESYSRRRRLLFGADADGGKDPVEDEDRCSATLPLDESSYWSASTAGTSGGEQRGTAVGSAPRRVHCSPTTEDGPAGGGGGAATRRRVRWQLMKSWGGGGGERGRQTARDRTRPPRIVLSKSLPPDAPYLGMTEGYECSIGTGRGD